MNLLIELLDSTSKDSPDIKAMSHYIHEISRLFFGKKSGPVIDKKRSKEPKYFGLSHVKSKLVDTKGRPLMLTFDNSTDSGEFELNTLAPMMIERGSDTDMAIKKLYRKYDVKSSKKTNYISRGGEIVLREIHFGKAIDNQTVKLAQEVYELLTGEKTKEKEE